MKKKFPHIILLSCLLFLFNPLYIYASDPISSWNTTTSLPYVLASQILYSNSNKIYSIGGSAATGKSKFDVLSAISDTSNGNLSTWTTTSASLSSALIWHSLAQTNNYIYILGGREENPESSISQVNTVYLGKVNSSEIIPSWDLLTSLPQKLALGAAAVVNDKIYYAGGFNDSNLINQNIYVASINADGTISNWSLAGSLPKALFGFGMIANGNNLVIIGGDDKNNQSQSGVYTAPVSADGTIDQWITTSNLPQGVYRSNIVKVGSRVFSLGGANNDIILKQVYYADLNADGTVGPWQTSLNYLPQPLCCGAAAATNDYIYLTGGFSDKGYLDTVYYTKIQAPYADFKQTDPTWSNNPNPPIGSNNYIYSTLLDHSSACKDMYMWGCAITAVADVLKSYGYNSITLANNMTKQIDPSSINDWMTMKNIFSECGAIFQKMGSSVGIADPIPFWINNTPANKVTAKNIIDDALNKGNLPIVGVNTQYGTHFIVLSQKLADLPDGTPDYSIIDPALYPFTAKNLDQSGKPLSTNYKWSNIFEVIVFDKNSSPTERTISFIGHSPIQFLITDPNGKQTGYQPRTNAYITAIPQSSYGTDTGIAAIDGQSSKAPESLIFNENNPVNGTYTLQVYNTGNGPYKIDFMSMTGSQNATHTVITGTAKTGKTDTYLVTISSASDKPIIIQRKVQINVFPEKIYPKAGILGVTIFGQTDLDVKNIDIKSIKLGNNEIAPLHNKGFFTHNRKNLLLFFNTRSIGLTSNDTQLCLTGRTKDGISFKGCDTIKVITPKILPVQPSFQSLIDDVDTNEASDAHQLLDSFKE